ncbi:MAG TPA: tetratricopeptide repeat protein [Xanthobacteraceae bacterium]|jgi:tetratricopeptide (TPR) repeat protein
MMLDVDQAMGEALGHHKAGRLAEAECLYRKVLAVDPQHADGLHLLGVVSHQAGRDDLAVDLIGKAIALNDTLADYHCNMGSALCGLGRHEHGIAHYLRAIALDPRHALACNNLGNALTDQGKSREGEEQLRRAIELKPDYAEAHYNLGNALAAQVRLEEAVVHYRRAIALAPDFANARNNLATALQQQGQLDEAAAQFARVLALEPQHASAHYNLGNMLRAKCEYDAAVMHYQQALAGRPDFADAWNNMGVAFAERGDLEAARNAYRKSVEADPTRAAYHRNLAGHKRFERGDPQLAVLEDLERNPQRVPEAERIDLQFALGKAYADLDQHELSFRHLLAGNAIKRAQIEYDETAAMAYMGRIRSTFSAEMMRARAGAGDPSPAPVFVVGMPRSGTTLIEQIIASHPRAAGAGELFDLDNIARSVPGFPEAVPGMSGEELARLGARYVAAVRAMAPAAERVVDKMPWNFHLCGLIHLALPNARIIHSRRNAVDTCLSCFSILFDGDSNLYTYDLGELGRFYRAYESLMEHWRAALPPSVMIEVQYEEVVADLETQARRIIAHCGLEWDDACLAFHKTRRPVRTSSVAQVRQPIYKSSIGRWRPYRDQLRLLFEGLGIDPANDSEPSSASDRTESPQIQAQRAILAFARMLEPKKALGYEKVRVGRDRDGGYVLIEDFSQIDGAFSFGIKDDASWDLDIAQRNIRVHQFDHTVDRAPAEHALLEFHKLRIAEADAPDAACLDTLVDKLLANAQRALLKVDIEGDEWDMLGAASPRSLVRFTQIACEFHELGRLTNPVWYGRFFAVIEKLKEQFEIVHVHGNNYMPFMCMANVLLPATLEVTFANRRHYQFGETNEIFPTPLDRPNFPDAPDLHLGCFKF